MRSKLAFGAILISASCGVIGCGGRSDSVSPITPFGVEQFPMAVGSRWTYVAEDTVLDLTDTVDVEITAIVSAGDEDLTTVWHYESRHNLIGKADEYVIVKGDTIYFRDERTGESNLKLVFPIVTNATWTDEQSYGISFSEVEGTEATKVPAGVYRAFRVRTDLTPMPLDLILGSRAWLAPRVGFVRIERLFGFRILEQYQVWKLIAYERAYY